MQAKTRAFNARLGRKIGKVLKRGKEFRTAIGIARIIDGIDSTKNIISAMAMVTAESMPPETNMTAFLIFISCSSFYMTDD